VPSADEAREQAREILAQRRYHDTDLPRPFRGPLRWAGDRLDDVGRWFAGRFDDVNAVLPGGAFVVWLLIGALVVALAALLARTVIRRRVTLARPPDGGHPAEEDPRELERAADAAERAGEWERALRLRFRAGVLRLRLEPGTLETTGEIAAALDSPTFDAFGADFDAIVYGGRDATEADAREAREAWAEVLR
jgi:hypothetical protein